MAKTRGYVSVKKTCTESIVTEEFYLEETNEGDNIHEYLCEFFDSFNKLTEMEVNINGDFTRRHVTA